MQIMLCNTYLVQNVFNNNETTVKQQWIMPPKGKEKTDTEREAILQLLWTKLDFNNKKNYLQYGAIGDAAAIFNCSPQIISRRLNRNVRKKVKLEEKLKTYSWHFKKSWSVLWLRRGRGDMYELPHIRKGTIRKNNDEMPTTITCCDEAIHNALEMLWYTVMLMLPKLINVLNFLCVLF